MINYAQIATNTALAEDLFKPQFLNSIVLHIPHSSYYIPTKYLKNYTNLDIVQSEIKLLTDHATQKIFNLKNITQIRFKYNRIFCDVERLPDQQEEMFPYGRGFYYTHTDDGSLLRNENDKKIVENIYNKYHQQFTNIVNDKINTIGFATIIDCHSFNDIPFKTDIHQELPRPDFCIGTNDYHTPKYLQNKIVNSLTQLGYSVTINQPYTGTIVPLAFYLKNDKVNSIMIEINRKLYMENNIVIPQKVKHLHQIISQLILEL